MPGLRSPHHMRLAPLLFSSPTLKMLVGARAHYFRLQIAKMEAGVGIEREALFIETEAFLR